MPSSSIAFAGALSLARPRAFRPQSTSRLCISASAGPTPPPVRLSRRSVLAAAGAAAAAALALSATTAPVNAEVNFDIDRYGEYVLIPSTPKHCGHFKLLRVLLVVNGILLGSLFTRAVDFSPTL